MSDFISIMKALTAIDIIIVLSTIVAPVCLLVAALMTFASVLFGDRTSTRPRREQTNGWNRDTDIDVDGNSTVHGDDHPRLRTDSNSPTSIRAQGMST